MASLDDLFKVFHEIIEALPLVLTDTRNPTYPEINENPMPTEILVSVYATAKTSARLKASR